MSNDAVLVLGNDDSKDVIEALFEAGFAPVVRKTMESLLAVIRRGRFAAVVVDRERADDDVLELTLNVRDVDSEIPVVIIGRSTDPRGDETLARQHRIYLLQTAGIPGNLANDLERVLTVE